MSESSGQPRLCLVTLPLSKTPEGTVRMGAHVALVSILEPVCSEIVLITGNFPADAISSPKVRVLNVRRYDKRRSTIGRALRHLKTQVALALGVIRLRKGTDITVFYIGGSYLLLPLLVSRLLGKKTMILLTGSDSESARHYHRQVLWGLGGNLISATWGLLAKVNFALCHRIGIVLKADESIRNFGLQKHACKIVPFGMDYIDTHVFSIRKSLQERSNIVGYVGRLSNEKGILELARAIPLMLAREPSLRFLIVGDGPLRSEVKEELDRLGCLDRVDFAGWVSQERIPGYMNEMKIHVLPSYTEGFGGANLQAMACGAIAIANSVGGVPCVIADGKTGFLLRDNSPQAIAEKVIEVLNRADLDQIQEQAGRFIRETFSYNKAVENCRIAFADLLSVS